MTNTNKRSSSLDWNQLFKDRPDLEPPGYRETVQRIADRKNDDDRKRLRGPGSTRK